eukprot:TRINITY_DN2468_c0_g1_i1.p1 TRINITY_DN2468_c0_g1~~TRINITY_DN2468_c0_g1_i1.p1  ORF type:complete len:714 (+),score=260.83 TRINITY_DN2468_c0_g1_i1:247-2142(+)
MSHSDTAVFGVPLSVLMARPHEVTIPSFVKQTIRYLNLEALYTEGLFRVTLKSDVLQELKRKINDGHTMAFDQIDDHHLVASLLKLYLKELPEPLFSFHLFHEFIEAARAFEDSDKGADAIAAYAATLNELVGRLEPPAQALSEILLLFLSRVGEHSARNQMTPSTLSVVFGPMLLRPEVETIETMMNASKVNVIVKFMIEHFEDVFPKQKQKARLCRRQKATEARKLQEIQSGHTDAQTEKEKREAEKLAKVKETVDDAICLVQKKLGTLSVQLKSTESLDVAIDIARRVRTAKKVLFSPMEGVAVEEPAVVAGSGAAGGGAERAAHADSAATSEETVVRPSQRMERPDIEGYIPFEVGVESLQGKRANMEDQHVVIEDATQLFPALDADKQWSYFGVYDGHGGAETSHLVSEYLHRSIMSLNEFREGDIFESFQLGFSEADLRIIDEGQQRGFKDGSTAVVAVLYEGTLYIANAGDSEAVLYRTSDAGELEAEVLTVKHVAKDPSEKERIEEAGGAVFSGRVFGALAVSRALGDRDFKVPTSEANFVSAEPHITAEVVTSLEKFLLLACDGLWDVVSYNDAGTFLSAQFQEGKSCAEAAAALAKHAIDSGSMDNVTVMVVRFFVEDELE